MSATPGEPTIDDWIQRLTEAGYDLVDERCMAYTSRGAWNGNHPIISIRLVFEPTTHEEWPKDKEHRRAYTRITLSSQRCNAGRADHRPYAMGYLKNRVRDTEVSYENLPRLC